MLNANKCKAMIVSCRAFDFITNFNVVHIHNIDLEYVEYIKYLGIVIDCEWTFHLHTDYVLKKISSKYHFLRR